MIRATTPQHIFTFPQDPSEYEKILVTLYQKGEIVLEKTESDMSFNSEKKQAWYRLSQEETNRFSPDVNVKLQVRVLANGGNAYASKTMSVSVYDVLNDTVLEGEADAD